MFASLRKKFNAFTTEISVLAEASRVRAELHEASKPARLEAQRVEAIATLAELNEAAEAAIKDCPQTRAYLEAHNEKHTNNR